MEKLNLETPDLVEGNIEKLGALFPSVVTETRSGDGSVSRGINFEALRQLLSKDAVEGEEYYEFTWSGKKAARAEVNRSITRTLRPVKAESEDWDTTENLYIEGENLEVLKILQESYLGRVKMIYIDPPYNTGHDLIYPDRFWRSQWEEEEEMGRFDEESYQLFENTERNGRFHSLWCSSLYVRLALARNLLSETGVIFISVDDNEAANLKKICDELFGEKNYVGQITVVGNPRGRDYGGVARMHDYVLVYTKSPDVEINLVRDPKHHFRMFDELGGFELRELRNRNIKFNKENRKNLYYPFYVNPEEADENGLHPISLTPKKGWVELYPLASQGVNTVWRWGKDKAKEHLNKNILAKPMKNGGYMIVEKYREGRMMARSVWWDKDTNTEKGTLLVKEMMEGKVFDYPKPVELLIRMCEMGSGPEDGDIILDFFSGSATTAHAVMKLNAEDGGNRRFIMVQVPHPCAEGSETRRAGYRNLCQMGRERIRRAGRRLREEHPQAALDTGFRTFRVDESIMEEVYYHPEEYTQEMIGGMVCNIRPDRTDLDLLYACLLDWGVELHLPHTSMEVDGCTIHDVGGGELMACFDGCVPESAVRAMAAQKPRRAVFRDSSFASAPDKINVTEIFKTFSAKTKVKVI